jgi:hypothetical protein
MLEGSTFRIEKLPAGSEAASRYRAHVDGLPRCEFNIELARPQASSDKAVLFAFTTGSLERREGADCTAFLKELAPRLGFGEALPNPGAVDRLEVQAAILGTHQSRTSTDTNRRVAGAFTPEPPGPWTATKLFLADGEGEVFLNLSDEGVGELSIKDEEYATTVVTELAKIMLPSRGAAQRADAPEAERR